MTTGGISTSDAATPDGIRLYAIGDVHGRFDLLQQMHRLIAAEILRDQPRDWRVIHLGDYVDRGPQSAQVLDCLTKLVARDPRYIALMGNHDEGMMEFLTDPTAEGARIFLNFGGVETAQSYGVALDETSRAQLLESHRLLLSALPDKHMTLLRNLPRAVTFGDFFFCHAGVRPGVALEAQDPHDLIWIRRAFLDHAELFEKVIVHGHTPHDAPQLLPNRVNVDTKAFATGRLTALVLDGREKRFLVSEGARA